MWNAPVRSGGHALRRTARPSPICRATLTANCIETGVGRPSRPRGHGRPVKREAGERPARTRHRDSRAPAQRHWETGKAGGRARAISRETCLSGTGAGPKPRDPGCTEKGAHAAPGSCCPGPLSPGLPAWSRRTAARPPAHPTSTEDGTRPGGTTHEAQGGASRAAGYRERDQ